MTPYGLRARVFTLTLAPTLIIGLLLSAFFTFNRYHDLEQQLIVTGENIIQPLAIASELSLADNNREAVRRLIGYAHRKHSDIVRSIAVFNRENKLFVTSNFHRNFDDLMYPSGTPISMTTESQHIRNELILRTPIFQENPILSEHRQQLNLPIGYIAIELDLSALRLQQYQEIFTAFVVLLLGLGLSALFAYRLMKDVTTPISHMVDVVDRIRRGHLDVRIEGKLLGELDTLKNGINAMAISLSEYHIEMQQSIDQATSDLRETLEQLEIQNIELDIAKKRAQEAARVKSEFLANMSHELRTPLNGVIGFTRQILKTQLTPNQTEYLQTIESSANNLLNIINDILDFSKLEAGKLTIEQIDFAIAPTLDDMIRLLAPSAHEKGLEIILNLDPAVPDRLLGDPLRLQQVLTNLVGNAVKFTESGYIEVSVTRKAEHAESNEILFSVKDSGIGISKSQQKQLFQAFSQADTSISRRYGGTGLGLVITQKLVSQMGGNIQLDSEINEGSTFYFRLFMTKSDKAQAPKTPTKKLINTALIVEPNIELQRHLTQQLRRLCQQVTSIPQCTEIEEHTYDLALLSLPANQPIDLIKILSDIDQLKAHSQHVWVSLPTTELTLSEKLMNVGIEGCLVKPISFYSLQNALTAQPADTKPTIPPIEVLPLNVLAVDDNSANLKLISALLKDQVKRLFIANSGHQAIDVAKEHALDIIFMDIQMPEMDGVTASQKIHQLPAHKNTPIIAVTAHAMAGERERLLNEGMNDYLTKPLEESALQQKIAQWCSTENVIAKSNTPTTAISKNDTASWDWELALKHAAGRPELAQEMLTLLLQSFDEVRPLLDQEIVDPTSLKAAIHKLHGGVAYTGTPRLKSLCQLIESELNKGVTPDNLEPELFELQDEMDKITEIAQSLKSAEQKGA